MREAQLPIEFMPLADRISGTVYRKSHNEYASPCPECGGEDRFNMLLNATGSHKVFAFCRQCDFIWFPGFGDKDWRPTEAEIAQRARAAEEALAREIAKAQAVLAEMKSERKWLEYHENLDNSSRQLWESRGIDRFFQDYWQLGYSDSFDLWTKKGEEWVSWWQSPTLTIPVWSYSWQLTNIKHRLLEVPQDKKGMKYRQERSGVPASPFICDPDRVRGPLVLCEGEIKSMVVFQTLDTNKMQVAGLPSSTPRKEMLAPFADYDPVYIIPDPDVFDGNGATRLENALGKDRVRTIRIGMKVDDAINDGILNKSSLHKLMRMSRE